MSESIVISVLVSLPPFVTEGITGKVGSFMFTAFAFSWEKVYTPLGVIRRWQHIAIQSGCTAMLFYQNQGYLLIMIYACHLKGNCGTRLLTDVRVGCGSFLDQLLK